MEWFPFIFTFNRLTPFPLFKYFAKLFPINYTYLFPMPKSKKVSPTKTAPVKEDKKSVLNMSFLEKIKDIKLPKNLEQYTPAFRIAGLVIIIIASFALIDLAVQYLNNDYSVAVVNGVRISKNKWHDRLEKSYGSSIATQLIEDQIIRSEAKEAKISVTEDEIQKEVDRIIESIGGEEMFNSALEANNITLNELKDQIETDLLATKILSPTLEYTEDNVKDFFNQYSDVIFPNETAELEEGAKLDFEKYKEETEEVYVQQQVQTNLSSWLTDRKAEYKIQDNSTGKPKYGFLTITTNIVSNLLEKMGSKGE